MARQSLAVKYRPKTFDDVSEQNSIKTILTQQIATNSIKNAYLFCGGAGTGKTTCARIFANEINGGNGNPIEMDAASNSSVDDVRDIIQQSKTKSLDSEYKVFIIDECHSLSNTAWQAFLKVLEEPPTKSIFVFCTTDPQKIPKTILSRVQRYDFQRISHNGIVNRLLHILEWEDLTPIGTDMDYVNESVEYIAKIADGGMRDAITLLDKCLAYSTDLTIDNVSTALGIVDYSIMYNLTKGILECEKGIVIKTIEDVYSSGKDIKQFIKLYSEYILDLNKYDCTGSMKYVKIPTTHQKFFDDLLGYQADTTSLLTQLMRLNADIKWETSPKALVEAYILSYMGG